MIVNRLPIYDISRQMFVDVCVDMRNQALRKPRIHQGFRGTDRGFESLPLRHLLVGLGATITSSSRENCCRC